MRETKQAAYLARIEWQKKRDVLDKKMGLLMIDVITHRLVRKWVGERKRIVLAWTWKCVFGVHLVEFSGESLNILAYIGGEIKGVPPIILFRYPSVRGI